MNHWFLHAGSDLLLEIKLFLCTLTFQSAVFVPFVFVLRVARAPLDHVTCQKLRKKTVLRELASTF